jgi:hypothetical protein
MGNFRNLWLAWKGARQFTGRANKDQSIVVYSEGSGYWKFLGPVVSSLIADYGREIDYVTSDINDPVLSNPPPNVRGYYVGSGSAFVYALQTLRAAVLLMTTPDLNNFHLKRSRYPVHYTYLHHSMVSTHMIYRKSAFDAFDSILCVGPHHVLETREWEKQHGLPEKELFEHGYGPLDLILEKSKNRPDLAQEKDGPPHILLAPSWGPDGILETIGEELINILMDAGYRVTIRPHPRTCHLSPEIMATLEARYSDHPHLKIDLEAESFSSLMETDLMISDWSGVAMEYAFGLEKPVLFIDVPAKTNNPDHETIAAIPFEKSYRDQVGTIHSADELLTIPSAIEYLLEDPREQAAAAAKFRNEAIFNPGTSGKNGAKIIVELADRAEPFTP